MRCQQRVPVCRHADGGGLWKKGAGNEKPVEKKQGGGTGTVRRITGGPCSGFSFAGRTTCRNGGEEENRIAQFFSQWTFLDKASVEQKLLERCWEWINEIPSKIYAMVTYL